MYNLSEAVSSGSNYFLVIGLISDNVHESLSDRKIRGSRICIVDSNFFFEHDENSILSFASIKHKLLHCIQGEL